MTHDRWHRWDDDRTGSWAIRATLWRVAASIVLPIVWLAGTLLFFAFWSSGLTWFQDLTVGVAAGLSLLGTLLLVWVSYGFRLARRWVDG
jgi:hypothetical protein